MQDDTLDGRFDDDAELALEGDVGDAATPDSDPTDFDDDPAGVQVGKEPLTLEVRIDPIGACQRHVTVTIGRDDIDRYIEDAYKELVPKAAVPGFRAGRAPRKLVERRFRKDVVEQVKNSLLMDSLTQVSQGGELAAISEPDFAPDAVELPETGSMTFEFNIEVRPEFDLPNWKGLTINRPVREFTEQDIDHQLKALLTKYGRLVPHEGAAGAEDYLVLNLTFREDGRVLSSVNEETIRIRPELSFRDGKVSNFDKLMVGCRAGDKRQAEAELSVAVPNTPGGHRVVQAEFEVLEVKRLELPELDDAFLLQLGGVDSIKALREMIRAGLQRRLEYRQQQEARAQVLAALTVAADWDLPPEMLKRQSGRELDRSVMELQRSGYTDAEIRQHENYLRQNSASTTARALKEHFILERIAEEEKIEDQPDDYDLEIELMAEQSNESPRRVRAQLEKRGLMDSLRNQIIERKVISLIQSHARFVDVPYQVEATTSEAVDQAALGGDEEHAIPEALHPDSSPAPTPGTGQPKH